MATLTGFSDALIESFHHLDPEKFHPSCTISSKSAFLLRVNSIVRTQSSLKITSTHESRVLILVSKEEDPSQKVASRDIFLEMTQITKKPAVEWIAL